MRQAEKRKTFQRISLTDNRVLSRLHTSWSPPGRELRRQSRSTIDYVVDRLWWWPWPPPRVESRQRLDVGPWRPFGAAAARWPDVGDVGRRRRPRRLWPIGAGPLKGGTGPVGSRRAWGRTARHQNLIFKIPKFFSKKNNTHNRRDPSIFPW